MNDVLDLPTGPLADASLALVRSTESRPIADHSIRSFIFARLLAEHEGALDDAAYDEELLFAAAVMHDLGLGEHAQGQARFEVEGADLAAEVLGPTASQKPTSTGFEEAIALHASHGLAERRGLLTYLTHKGVFIDAGRITDAVADELRKEVHNAYPKPTERVRRCGGVARQKGIAHPSWLGVAEDRPGARFARGNESRNRSSPSRSRACRQPSGPRK
jgi:hypothetical protein